MADADELFDSACDHVVERFKVENLKDLQRKALKKLVIGEDVFLIQPTGSGKSLIYQSAPMVFDIVKRTTFKSIAVVISPLTSLMQDQVKFLKSIGVTAEFIGEDQQDDAAKTAVERGDCQIVFGSPESFLSSHRWRKMLSSKVYEERLCLVAVDEAHCISHWGYAAKKGERAFRKWFSRINEIRSIIKKVPVIALTATATTETRLQTVRTLEMKSPALIVDIPNRQNISYGVQVITPNPSVTFAKMVSDLKVQKTAYERTIIYCPTIKLTTHLYGFFQAELRENIYADEVHDPKKRIVEMFHSRSDELNKEEILKSMGESNGCIRVLIATIAYGMGINCKDVKTVIHYGPSYNCETYLQESGRAGRRGQDQCKSVILYSNIMTKHCHESMVTYLKQNDKCRRKVLLEKFDVDVSKLPAYEYPHRCCDICQQQCKCDGDTCNFVFFNLECSPTALVETESNERTVTEDQMTLLNSKLNYLKRALNQQFLQSAKKSNAPMFTPAKLFCGFGDNQIKQIMQHCSHMFSASDVYKYVDIWHPTVASEVLFTISTIFEDVDISHLDMEESEDTQEYYFDSFDAIFDFDVEDSLMAAIPLELLSVDEDTMDSDMEDSN
ncbi:uncharacterized protein [Montipora capricornis]